VAEQITKRCVEEWIRGDHTVVYLALLFHDAGFVEDHVAPEVSSPKRLIRPISPRHGYDSTAYQLEQSQKSPAQS
jgi:hypothetical protein